MLMWVGMYLFVFVWLLLISEALSNFVSSGALLINHFLLTYLHLTFTEHFIYYHRHAHLTDSLVTLEAKHIPNLPDVQYLSHIFSVLVDKPFIKLET